MGPRNQRRTPPPHAREGVMSGERSALAGALVSALSSDRRLAAWQVRSTRRSERQTYLVRTQLESQRHTEGETCVAEIHVKNGELLGRTTMSLVPGDAGGIAKRLDDAVYMAGMGGDAPWTLPGPGERPRIDLMDEAHDLTHAAPPPTGQYPVVIDAEEISNLLAPIRVNASGPSLYQKSSRFEPGKPLSEEVQSGEPLNLFSNATAPYGLASYAFDANGVAGQRVQIVKDGTF